MTEKKAYLSLRFFSMFFPAQSASAGGENKRGRSGKERELNQFTRHLFLPNLGVFLSLPRFSPYQSPLSCRLLNKPFLPPYALPEKKGKQFRKSLLFVKLAGDSPKVCLSK